MAIDTCTVAVGIAVSVSVSVTFVVSFSLGVLVASVLCYISRRSKESYKPSSHADPATVYDEVGTNKKIKGDVMEVNTMDHILHRTIEIMQFPMGDKLGLHF